MHHFIGQKHKGRRRQDPAVSGAPKPHGPYVRVLDKVTFVAGVIGPFTVLPQIYQIYIGHSAAGVSATSWALMFIVTMPWVFYGLAHCDKSIIISFFLWEVMNALVFIGAIIYH